jgi:AraC-like DNA-binding protein
MEYIAHFLEYIANRSAELNDLTLNFSLLSDKKYPINCFTGSVYYNQESIYRDNSPFHQILVILDGHGRVICNGEEHELREGCAFFTAAGSNHTYESYGDLKSAYITATGPAADALAKEFSDNGFVFWESFDTQAFIEDIKNFKNERNRGVSEARLSTLTYSIFANALSKEDATQSAYLSDTVRYIEMHFSDKITLDDLAGRALVSKSKLCHDFKEKYGVAVIEYIMEFRLTYAHELLHTASNIAIKDVARLSGFTDSAYFAKAYKKRYGISPIKERNRR